MFTGSGMPMRFADLDGTMIDVYQATTQMTDESGQTLPAHTSTRCSTRRSAPRATTARSPPTCTPTTRRIAGSDAIVASAQARGVPVVSAPQMLTWLDGRNGSSFSVAVLERQHADVHDRRRGRSERPAGDGADARRPSAP